MRHHLISIVMPAFNAGKYIRESINSVLNQSFDNWELIIVDDASTDNTYYIAREYAEKLLFSVCLRIVEQFKFRVIKLYL